MLQLHNVSKSYTTGDFTQVALDGVNLEFGKTEFVAVLGPSGSGKTTFLNLIGGLDKYDSGDLIINGKSTKDFADWEWDAYRNNSVGFVFQTYNLITHLSGGEAALLANGSQITFAASLLTWLPILQVIALAALLAWAGRIPAQRHPA